MTGCYFMLCSFVSTETQYAVSLNDFVFSLLVTLLNLWAESSLTYIQRHIWSIVLERNCASCTKKGENSAMSNFNNLLDRSWICLYQPSKNSISVIFAQDVHGNTYPKEKYLWISSHYCRTCWIVFSEVHSKRSVAFFIPFANWHCFWEEEVKRDVCSREWMPQVSFWGVQTLEENWEEYRWQLK